MKKKIVALFMVSVLTLVCLSGCAGSESAAPDADKPVKEDITEEPAEIGTEETEESQTGMANPWVEISEKDAGELCTRLFTAPEGAHVQAWLKCESLGDPDKYLGPLVQLNFELDGMEFTARAQQGASEDADISGIYTEWTVEPEDVTLANWGEGHMTGQMYRSVSDEGYLDLITWYDIEIGIKYSLTVEAPDLDGFDIQAVAESMYTPDNEPVVE